MQGQSPSAMRSSADLDRMQALLAATGLPAPITSPSFPAVKLDVAACYDHLNSSRNHRPEDMVMRQALELYCSLISPPTTPTATFNSAYQFQQDQLPVSPSGIFTCEDEYPSSMPFDEPKLRDYDPSTDPNRPFGFASGQNDSSRSNPYAHQPEQTHYSWSTPSCVSDHETSDTDDMDDPFACYPLSHPRGLTPQSYSPQINYHHHRSSSYETSSHKVTHSYSSQQRIQISAHALMGQLEGSRGMDKAVSADARSSGNPPQSLARLSFFSPTAEPIAPHPKPAGRKRSFSVVTFGKQRKPLASHAASLRISGPVPIDTSHSASSPGTFSVPVGTSRSSLGRLSSGGCLSPALEVNEDISPIQPTPSKPIPMRTRSNTGSQFSGEETNPMSLSRKFTSRPDTKSLWKTLKTSTTRGNFVVERPLVQHLNH